MNTKEAIDFVKKHNTKEHFYTWERKGFKEIITLLMRGSAFEKMFREVENMYGSSLTWDIEQKYFPESIKKTIAREVIK